MLSVVFPPVDVDESGTLRADKDDYYVTAAFLAPYKRTDLVIDAFNAMPTRKLLVVGDGQQAAKLKDRAGPNISFAGYLPRAEYIEAVSRARALVFAGCEDFGIALAEAQAYGTPLIAFARGGAMDIVRPLGRTGEPTGVLFEHQSAQSVIDAVKRFDINADQIRPLACRRTRCVSIPSGSHAKSPLLSLQQCPCSAALVPTRTSIKLLPSDRIQVQQTRKQRGMSSSTQHKPPSRPALALSAREQNAWYRALLQSGRRGVLLDSNSAEGVVCTGRLHPSGTTGPHALGTTGLRLRTRAEEGRRTNLRARLWYPIDPTEPMRATRACINSSIVCGIFVWRRAWQEPSRRASSGRLPLIIYVHDVGGSHETNSHCSPILLVTASYWPRSTIPSAVAFRVSAFDDPSSLRATVSNDHWLAA